MSQTSSIPKHIAIIMDGNGRWAKQRNLPRTAGHKSGADAVERTVEACAELGVEFVTLYAFSAENWKRPKAEIAALMLLLDLFLGRKLKVLQRENIRLRTIGRTQLLPANVQSKLEETIEKTKDNTGLTLTLALSYGGREEIIDAAKEIAAQCLSGKLTPDEIDHNVIQNNLYAPDIPDPDLLIRTSGEIRLSNFLLWQLSYTEMVLIDKFWPDFDKEDVIKAIETYQTRHRRFGEVS